MRLKKELCIAHTFVFFYFKISVSILFYNLFIGKEKSPPPGRATNSCLITKRFVSKLNIVVAYIQVI